ncbi:recombinase family protein [Vreelandella alkaliphila]|uniref:recombinase family protein n=2 Tax=Oceanospirillales TaxID=135619 RepID=UPI0005FCBE72|nr:MULTISPECIES: recombinase family protein [unclassified Halomonas]CEP35426.1 Resolvase, N-terminal domain protein [Halomonas sp. R57-5]
MEFMSGKHVGYIRVSTVGQNSDRQLDGIQLDKVFEEKVSGRNAGSRDILNLCLDYLREHDTLHVHSIDRLARNMSDLLSIVDDLVKRDVTVKFHSEGLTFAPQTDDPMASLMLHMLGAFAEFERSLIGQRRKEGLEAARKRGKQIGRRKSLSDEDLSEIAQKLSKGDSKSDLAKEYGVSRTTLYAALNKFQEA